MNTKKFEAAFLELVEEDTESALQLITGMFVGLTLEYTRRRGEDASKTLRINGCGNRDITIHKLPNNPLPALLEASLSDDAPSVYAPAEPEEETRV